MRPRPRLAEVRQFGGNVGRLDANRGQQRALGHARQPGLGDVEYNQHEPRTQSAVTLRLGGRQHPYEFGRIEVDDRKVVRLEVARLRLRIGAHDEAGVDADHIARAVQAQLQWRDHLGVVRRDQLDADGGRPARGEPAAEVVLGVEGDGEPATYPRQELIRDRHGALSSRTTSRTLRPRARRAPLRSPHPAPSRTTARHGR